MGRVLMGLALLSLGFASSAAAQDQARGVKVYADQKCSVCHAIAGKGNAKGALDSVGSKLTSAEIHEWIVESGRHDREAQGRAKARDAREVHVAPEGGISTPSSRISPR